MKGFSVFVFIAVWGFSVFFTIWFSVFIKNINKFSDLVFHVGFSYLGSGFSLI